MGEFSQKKFGWRSSNGMGFTKLLNVSGTSHRIVSNAPMATSLMIQHNNKAMSNIGVSPNTASAAERTAPVPRSKARPAVSASAAPASVLSFRGCRV